MAGSSPQKSSLTMQYIACYAIWLVLSAMGIWLLFALRPVMFGIAVALRANPWQVRAIDNFGVVTLGLVWLVGIFILENALRRGVERHRMWPRAARVFAVLAALLALSYALAAWVF